jgi:hypothetical protein
MGGGMGQDALAMIEYDGRIPVFVLGDSAAAIARMAETAEVLGCRIARSAAIGDRAPADWMPGLPLLMELGEPAGEATIAALDRARDEAERGERQVLVSGAAPFGDLLSAAPSPQGFDWFVDGSALERVLAVALASRPRALCLHDIGREDGSLILQQLTEDVSRIAAMLASLTDDEAAALEGAKAGEGKEEPGLDAAYVRSIIRARRLRDQFFRGGLFADPAWDMLLDLMAARLDGTRVAVSSLCIAAAVPATTALRWIKALTDRGLFVRSADPQDGRRVYIALSDDAARALTAYLRAAQRIAPTAI